MDFFKNALETLPSVAQSPLAFVAYIMLLITWLIISIRVKRNKQLLNKLDQLPEKDRIVALQMEMGVAKIRQGLGPKDWLKSKIYNYLFIGFLAICLVVVILFVVSAYTDNRGTSEFDITTYEEAPLQSQNKTEVSDEKGGGLEANEALGIGAPTSVSINNAYTKDGVQHALWQEPGMEFPKDLEVTYSYERQEKQIIIKPELAYLDIMRKGGPITGYGWGFKWQYPELSVKIINNTDKIMVLSEVKLDVKNSQIDLTPVLRVEDNAARRILILNEGWGKVIDPFISFSFAKGDSYDNISFNRKKMSFEVKLPTFFEYGEIALNEYITNEKVKHLYDEDFKFLVYGFIDYKDEYGVEKSVKFKQFQVDGLGGGIEPKYFYNIMLEAGESNIVKRLPISHSIAPGEAEHFVVRIGSNKSAFYELEFSLIDVGGVNLPGKVIQLHTFVPRNFTGAGERSKSNWQ